ncbi:MAG TPA: very short patch repair endonuclease [Solirubrobacterales bacterium]
MTDTRTREQRSRIMAAVKGKNTTPEILLRKALFEAGIRGWRNHYKRAAGTPDLAWPKLKVAVFVDGAFWHGHPSRHKPGRSGRYWDEKIEANVARDRRVDASLEDAGWTVVRIWDFEIKRALPDAVERIAQTIQSRLSDRPAVDWQRKLRGNSQAYLRASRPVSAL